MVTTAKVNLHLWAGIFVGRVKELTRVTEINTKIVQSNSLKLVLISVTRVNSLTRPTKIPTLSGSPWRPSPFDFQFIFSFSIPTPRGIAIFRDVL